MTPALERQSKEIFCCARWMFFSCKSIGFTIAFTEHIINKLAGLRMFHIVYLIICNVRFALLLNELLSPHSENNTKNRLYNGYGWPGPYIINQTIQVIYSSCVLGGFHNGRLVWNRAWFGWKLGLAISVMWTMKHTLVSNPRLNTGSGVSLVSLDLLWKWTQLVLKSEPL